MSLVDIGEALLMEPQVRVRSLQVLLTTNGSTWDGIRLHKGRKPEEDVREIQDDNDILTSEVNFVIFHMIFLGTSLLTDSPPPLLELCLYLFVCFLFFLLSVHLLRGLMHVPRILV